MPPYQIEWLDQAKMDVRRLDRPTAMRIFAGILRYARTGGGDVAPLHGDMAGAFRLRLVTTGSCSACATIPCESSVFAIPLKLTAKMPALYFSLTLEIPITMNSSGRLPVFSNECNSLSCTGIASPL
jgi:hypothetical protein